MSWGEQFKFRMQVCSLMMAVMCPGFLIWMSSTAKRQIDSYSWPETPGVIESTTAKRWLDEDKVTMYYGRVAYRYEVDGREYISDLTDLGPGAKRSDQRTALADVDHYVPGENVAVYYDPINPSVAVVEKGIPQAQMILLIALCIGSVVSIVGSVFVIRSWLRSKHANAN